MAPSEPCGDDVTTDVREGEGAACVATPRVAAGQLAVLAHATPRAAAGQLAVLAHATPRAAAGQLAVVAHQNINLAPAWNLQERRLPPGYRFLPRDDELIVFYLRNKKLGLPLPVNKIHDVDLYEHNPADLAEMYEQEDANKWYFFTPTTRKYPKGSRPRRSAREGYWKATGADKTIWRNGAVVGWRKALVFYTGRPGKGDKTNWQMQEYRAKDDAGPRQFDGTMKLEDCVLCKVHKREDSASRRRVACRLADQVDKSEELEMQTPAPGTPPPCFDLVAGYNGEGLPSGPAHDRAPDGLSIMVAAAQDTHQILSSGDHRQLYGSGTGHQPSDSIVQGIRVHPEPIRWLPQESVRQSGDGAHVIPWSEQTLMSPDYWMAEPNVLGYPLQDIHPVAALPPPPDAYGACPGVAEQVTAGDYWEDLKITDPAAHHDLFSNLWTGLEIDPASTCCGGAITSPLTIPMDQSDPTSSIWSLNFGAADYTAQVQTAGSNLEFDPFPAASEIRGVGESHTVENIMSDLTQVPDISCISTFLELNLEDDVVVPTTIPPPRPPVLASRN